MENSKFNQVIKPLNIRYKEIFGYIPRITDYSCTREDYINALNISVKENKELKQTLTERIKISKKSQGSLRLQ